MISAKPNRPMATTTKPMPSVSSGTPNEKRAMPELTSVPTMPSSRPSTIIAIALTSEPLASTTAAIRPSTISEKYSAGPNLSATSASGGANAATSNVANGAGDERADRGDRQRRAGAPLARHLVAVEAGDHARRLPGQVDQDRRRRAAVLRAVVDARQHDQRRDGRQRVGDRQQHRDGRHRPDARQHADQRAEQHAAEAVEQVLVASARRRSRWRGWRTGPSAQRPVRNGGHTGSCTPRPQMNAATVSAASTALLINASFQRNSRLGGARDQDQQHRRGDDAEPRRGEAEHQDAAQARSAAA